MAQRKRKRLLCAWVSYLCLESKRINVSLRAQFFLQLWCQGLSTFIAASVVNLNALFVTLNLQINPLLMHYMQRTYTHTHTRNTEAQLGRDVTCLPKSFFLFLEVLWTTSQCASALLLSTLTPFFSHDPFMNTSSCKASLSTWGYFCSIMHGGGIKTVDAMASPFPCHMQAPGGQWRASVTRNRAPRLATHTSRGVGSMCEEHGIKRGTSVATGLWRPGTMVAPGQPQSPGPCRKG